MNKNIRAWIDQKTKSIALIMLLALAWESLTTGWDDPQKLVLRVFAITVLGVLIGSIFGFLWKRSHFSKWF